MNEENIKRAYLGAALAAAGIVSAIVIYTVVVELLRMKGYAGALKPPAAYAVKYALYVIGASALVALKFAGAITARRRGTPEETLKALTADAIIKAALCETPAIAGLVMFLLTGYRADFYLLVVFALGLEIYHFPRLNAWRERLRGDFGQL